MSAQPLEGVKVVDFSQVMLGPCATQMLGDYGADIIKIERPRVGDLSRASMGEAAGPDNTVFASLNRNKRSIVIDMRSDVGRETVFDLVRGADVLVHNFRPGVMERRGFGYEELQGLNPRLIYAVASGFGPTGPYAHKGGQDVLAQALTGVMARRSDETVPLTIYATALADYTAGMHLVQGILLALVAREGTGKGQRVDTSLFDSMLAMQMQEATTELTDGVDLNWAAMPLSGVFETSDGAIVLVGAFKENPLRAICVALEIDDLSLDERFSTRDDQKHHRAELQGAFRERFRQAPSDHWIERLESQDLLCARVQTLKEALQDPQTEHNKMVLEMKRPDGSMIHSISSPVHLSAAPVRSALPPPRLGEHTDAILIELGYSPERIAALHESGVLG